MKSRYIWICWCRLNGAAVAARCIGQLVKWRKRTQTIFDEKSAHFALRYTDYGACDRMSDSENSAGLYTEV